LAQRTLKDSSDSVFEIMGWWCVPRNPNQLQVGKGNRRQRHGVCHGPAGTGKTYTAVALAVRALKTKSQADYFDSSCSRSRGNLGFPGDLKEEIGSIFTAFNDALSICCQAKKLRDYLEKHVISIAPLAFMRGTEGDPCFRDLDEAQNTHQSHSSKCFDADGKVGLSLWLLVMRLKIEFAKNQPSGW